MPLIPLKFRILPSSSSKPIPPGQVQKLADEALRRYLLDVGPEEIRQAKALWGKYAVRKDLINFEDNNAKTLWL